MSIWPLERLEDICVKITDGAHNSPPTMQNSGYLMASVKDMTSFGLNLSTCRNISEEDYENLVRQGCKPEINDVLIAKDGNSCLETVMVQRKEQSVVLLSSVAILRPDVTKVLPEYLSLYLSEESNIRQMKELLVSGSAIPRVVLKSFREYKIPLPPIDVQTKITSILGSINNKIESNLKCINIIEEMANLIYRHYFVNFTPFKDEEFTETEIGLVPRGWKIKKLGELYNTSSGGTPSRKKQEYYELGSINWLKTKELKDNFIFETEEKITEIALNNSSAKTFPQNTVIIAMYGATVGKLGILGCESSTNQACCGILEKDEIFNYSFAYLYLLHNRENIINLANGGAQQNINQQIIKNLLMVVPPKEILEPILEKLKRLLTLKRENERQIIQLNNIKEYLLPRFLSGNIDLEEQTLQNVNILK